jgi:hypothetical protein
VGWVIVWSGSHLTGVRSWSGVGVFEGLTRGFEAKIKYMAINLFFEIK